MLRKIDMNAHGIEVPLIDDGIGDDIAGPDTGMIQYFLPGTAPDYRCSKCSEVSNMEHCLIRYLNVNSSLERSKEPNPNPCYRCEQGKKNREDFSHGVFTRHFGLQTRRRKDH